MSLSCFNLVLVVHLGLHCTALKFNYMLLIQIFSRTPINFILLPCFWTKVCLTSTNQALQCGVLALTDALQRRIIKKKKKKKVQGPSSAAVLSSVCVCVVPYCRVHCCSLNYSALRTVVACYGPTDSFILKRWVRIAAVARGDSCKPLPPLRLCCWR